MLCYEYPQPLAAPDPGGGTTRPHRPAAREAILARLCYFLPQNWSSSYRFTVFEDSYIVSFVSGSAVPFDGSAYLESPPSPHHHHHPLFGVAAPPPPPAHFLARPLRPTDETVPLGVPADGSPRLPRFELVSAGADLAPHP